ncbi:makorin, ring finger protein, 4 isoform X3 [Takifugu flavidus]|uniref:makorin, ring finger protein, 4 isoform X3 n=1 Tax=Takifugu flavidus TaxID=433684 RepID=UPI002544021A|nr:makorin, ring finger protein, 4 isoform X3 [Takifugu flavidus]
MDSARSERVCRYFLNGGCRLGSRCKYRHERPVSMQPCRYFQKGGCWYGESCRYRHVPRPESAAVTGRRCSAPAVSSTVAPTRADRRGSQPAVLQAEVMPRQECSQSFAVHVSNPQGDIGQRVEKQPRDSTSSLSPPLQLEQNLVPQEMVSNDATKEDGAAASSHTRENVPVTCGICMDNVYEKKPPRDNVFGILPNCNHAFCKQCITTWRKMREYGPDVVKSCPQCRVKSAFYVPSKQWVEGQEKERLIAAFRERSSKKNCKYFTRYRCCPFETECLYLHDKHARWSSPYHTEEDDDDYVVGPLNLLLALTLLGRDLDEDDEDYLDFPFYLSVEYD